jgi:dihydroflavonol-4-reductase
MNTGMTVAVTGGTGFTGAALIKRLLDDGYRVHALARSPLNIVSDSLEVIAGDLGNEDALFKLVQGVDTVFHIAAMYRSEGTYEEFLAVNYDGTRALLDASRRAGVRRFIYCSTIGVHGTVAETPADENAPYNPRDYYQETKLMAEKYCLGMHGQGIEVVVIRPCGIYGPGDTRMLKMFRMIDKGMFFFVGSAQPNFHPVYIDDLVQGFVLAMTAEQAAGEAFIIGGPRYLPLREYVATAANAMGARVPSLTIPYGLMSFAAASCEWLCKPMGIQPPLHRRRLTFFKHNRAFSIDKARRLLGYEPKTELDEGFRRTVGWYREHGMLDSHSST